MTDRARFDVHGVLADLETDHAPLADAITRDLRHFQVPVTSAPAHVVLRAEACRPPRPPAGPRWPAMRRGWVTERGGERWVDYRGRAVVRSRGDAADLWSDDDDLLWEAAYLFLMSRVGERLDLAGVHRVHALGVARGGRGALVLLPSGGGKSTLGLAALAHGLALLSDDTPLLADDGALLPFPARLGFTQPPPGVPPERVRPFRRVEHGVKWLVDVDAVAPAVSAPVRPGLVIVGRRDPGRPARATPLAAARAWPALLAGVVAGIGLPQVVEHFLRPDPRDLADKARIAASRARACRRLLRESEVWHLDLGADRAAAQAELLRLLDARLS